MRKYVKWYFTNFFWLAATGLLFNIVPRLYKLTTGNLLFTYIHRDIYGK